MKFKRYISIILAFMILLTTVGCETNIIDKNEEDKGQVEAVDYTPVEGGTVYLPITNFNTLNPLLTNNASYYYFSKLIYEGLFDFDKNLNVTPLLAETYEIKNEGRTISIKLKEGVMWHDGNPLTSSDIAFTIDTIKYANMDSAYSKMFTTVLGSYAPSDIRRIMDVKIIDENNVDIVFDRQFSNNLEVLTFPIIPKHAFSNGGGNKDFIKALETENYYPIGTGPFKFVNYEKFKTVTLVGNDEYRDGKPYLKEVVGKVLESEELVLTSFETGQINVATAIGVDWDKYNQNSRIKALEYVSPNYEFLGFNFNNDIFLGDNGKAIRKAIVYGIDRQAIIQKIYLGHGTQVDVPLHPDTWLLSPYANTYGYSLELAKEELKSRGWIDRDGDGFVEDETGKKLSLKLITNPSNILRLRGAEIIKDDLKKIGIDIVLGFDNTPKKDITEEIIAGEWEELNSTLQSGDFDLALLGWQMSVIPDISFMFHSSQIDYGTNFIKYSNETMDQLLTDAFIMNDRNEKLNSYENLQKFIVEELPYISLFFKNKALLVDSKIVGDLSPTFFNPYNGIKNCYIPKDFQ